MSSTDYSTIYDPDTDFDAWYTIASARAIVEHLHSDQTVLELGCATGLMTEQFAKTGVKVTGIDRSSEYLIRAQKRGLPGTTWTQADALEYLDTTTHTYDHITVCNLLHEVNNPSSILKLGKERLNPKGLIHITLQNPRSIHRLVAKNQGLIDDLCAISDRGATYGTQRLLFPEDVRLLVEEAGLKVCSQVGVMLKPLPNSQMETLPREVLEGFVETAIYFPDHSAMTYITAHG